jgi:hypothetical protein
MNALKKVKKLIAISLLANTLYITPIWAQAVQSSQAPIEAATQTNDKLILIDFFRAFDEDGNILVRDAKTGGYLDKNGESYEDKIDIGVAKDFEGWLTIDGEGNSATLTFTEKASELSDTIGSDALDSLVVTALAIDIAYMGFTGRLTFNDHDGSTLTTANIDKGELITWTDLNGETTLFPQLVALEAVTMPTEQSNSGKLPAQSEGQSGPLKQQKQGSVSPSGTLQGK